MRHQSAASPPPAEPLDAPVEALYIDGATFYPDQAVKVAKMADDHLEVSDQEYFENLTVLVRQTAEQRYARVGPGGLRGRTIARDRLPSQEQAGIMRDEAHLAEKLAEINEGDVLVDKILQTRAIARERLAQARELEAGAAKATHLTVSSMMATPRRARSSRGAGGRPAGSRRRTSSTSSAGSGEPAQSDDPEPPGGLTRKPERRARISVGGGDDPPGEPARSCTDDHVVPLLRETLA